MCECVCVSVCVRVRVRVSKLHTKVGNVNFLVKAKVSPIKPICNGARE